MKTPNGVTSAVFLILLCLCARPSLAQVSFTFNIDDPGSTYSAYDTEIQQSAQAAGADWAQYLLGSSTLNLDINFADIPTAQAASDASVLVGTDGPTNVYEQGASYKLQTGHSANGDAFDGTITLGTDYLTQDLWFDPNSTAETTLVPGSKIDAVSVFEHEIGHVLAFNGFRDGTTGALPSNYESTFDQYVVSDNGGLFFEGPQAMAAYGGPVPLTYGDYGHVGNSAPLPGSDLVTDLMNGVALEPGTRYDISALDLAITADVGVPIDPPLPRNGAPAVPEDSPLALLGLGLLILGGFLGKRVRGRGSEEARE